MHPSARIEYRTAALKAGGLWREPPLGAAHLLADAGVIDARSNDYLGLASQPVSRETPLAAPGSAASRLISGTQPEHLELERCLADWLQTDSCLLFSSGYAANVGALSALAGPGEIVLSDALNHASIVDGCRLSRAEVIVLPHLDVDALERALAASQGVRWVVTESYFSMDADTPDLARMRHLCDRYGAALVVDEAHALGVFGPQGRGLCAERGVVPDVLIGGMGKGLGVQGGLVAGRTLYRDWLWNRARSFVFSTAPSPMLCEVARGRVELVREAEAARARLQELERQLVAVLAASGIPTSPGRHGPIFPLVLGHEQAALDGAARARERRVLCQAIRPPTVARGSSRLRVTLRADMSDADVAQIARAMTAAWAERSLSPAPDSTTPAPAPNPRQTRGEDTAARPARGATSSGPTERYDTAGDGLERRPSASTTATLSRRPADTPSVDRSSTPAPKSPALTQARRWVLLGTGTGVGKSYVARALIRAIAGAGYRVAGLKPVETGFVDPTASDAAGLEALAFGLPLPSPHPLYAFADPITPARAARLNGTSIDISHIVGWVSSAVPADGESAHLVVETAGGVFSPLTDQSTNFELAAALEPATWVLVAPNRLGVLHDVSSTLRAMEASGRAPDWVVLSATETADTSTSSNRDELARLKGMPPVVELPRNDEHGLTPLVNS